MTAFQIQTFIPQDGNFSITLPSHLRGAAVDLSISKEETSKPTRLSDEEYLEGIRSLRGILTGTPDSSGLRDETDRVL